VKRLRGRRSSGSAFSKSDWRLFVFTGKSQRRFAYTTIRLHDDALTSASRNCWKKLSTSVVVVKKKLRRLSSVGAILPLVTDS